MGKQLHIVSFDVPFPANYGGVIDVFYKLKSLHARGVRIILHCFLYGQKQQAPELALYCEQVYYYRRTIGVQGFSLLRPYIVNSRKNTALLNNLLSHEAPILFEGLHSCYFLNHPKLVNRNKYVRAHNIEHEYYLALAQSEKKWWKRFYYKIESQLLRQYEEIYSQAEQIFAISKEDQKYFRGKNLNTAYLPAFHSNTVVESLVGRGEYCLYHGNLSVAENEEAVMYLIDNVFSKLSYPVKIAGANPSIDLITRITDFSHIELFDNPTDEEMSSLIENAHVHVLYSAKRSGLKLKLVNSLFKGRFVLVNNNLIETGPLESVCKIANNSQEYIQSIKDLWTVSFTEVEIESRKEKLLEEFSIEKNTQKLIETIFLNKQGVV